MSRGIGVGIIVLALAIAVVPAVTDCLSQGRALTLANGNSVPMKCHWTGLAEIAVGAPLLLVGAMMVGSRRRESLLPMGIMGVALGAAAVLLPQDFFIGVCQTPTMLCHTLMRPALTVFGSLAVIGSLGIVVVASRAGRKVSNAPYGAGA